MKNYMKEIAEILGVELGETFKVTYDTCSYKLMEDGMYTDAGNKCPAILFKILLGEIDIIKLPFIPEMYEQYYYVLPDGTTTKSHYSKNIVDYGNTLMHNCFKTSEEAFNHKDSMLKIFASIDANKVTMVGQ